MPGPPNNSDADASEELEKPSLGYERTRVASERTLMAWVRTAVSLIGFGFSIPKFFNMLAEAEPGARQPRLSPRAVGILLIALGTIGLVGGLVEHVRLMRRITPAGHERDKLSVALFTALAVGLVGLFAFVNVLVS